VLSGIEFPVYPESSRGPQVQKVAAYSSWSLRATSSPSSSASQNTYRYIWHKIYDLITAFAAACRRTRKEDDKPVHHLHPTVAREQACQVAPRPLNLVRMNTLM